MRLQESIAFYLLIGVGIAVAMLLNIERRTMLDRILVAVSAALFWPMYLPLLLSQPAAPSKLPDPRSEPPDEMAAAIAEVNSELDAALSSLDGWAENVLESERFRLAELRTALVVHAARIRSMDVVLAGNGVPAGDAPADTVRPNAIPGEMVDRRRRSEAARGQNVARLAAVRRQSFDDLMATLAWVRELVSMIHLAKFTGAPASRAEELVAQIAAAVEGISTVAAQPARPHESSPYITTETSSHPLQDRSIDTWASSNAPAT